MVTEADWPPQTYSVRVETRKAVVQHMLDEEQWIIISVDPSERATPGGTTIRMGFPALIVTGWVAEPEQFAAAVAALLTGGQP
jgi:hypothetical protein